MKPIPTLEDNQCSKCKNIILNSEFQQGSRWCKKCRVQCTRQYRQSHKAEMREYTNAYLQLPEDGERRRLSKQRWDRKHRLDPYHRLSNNIRTNMYHALQGKKGFCKWESLVGYTLQDLITHIQHKLTPDMTWDNYGSTWQIDHITPKSWFKYTTAQEDAFKQCWSLSNLQPKLKAENISKGNR